MPARASSDPPRGGRFRATSFAVLLVSAVASFFARDLEGLRHRYEQQNRAEWFSRDPDGLYHARRVRRALDEPGLGLAASSDPYLDPPRGAPIPWPPYYDTLLAVALSPLVPPQEPARSEFIERKVATLPAFFGTLTSALAAASAALLAGPAAGLFAGLSHACSWGSINYSTIGTGDHHAWIALLLALALALSSLALERGVLAARWRAWLVGLAIGALYGLMLGSWVAALVLFCIAQLWLVLLLYLAPRANWPGAAPLGAGVHLGALALLFPAVLASPWSAKQPWIVVNLSWFHAAWIGLGALSFLVPALFSAREGARWQRFWLPGLGAAAALVVLATWNVPGGPVQGVREGLRWVSRADSFMGTVRESAPLIGSRGGLDPLLLAVGLGVFLLPLAWVFALRCAWRERRLALLPWLCSAPPMLAQALLQRRFSDVLAIVVAVLLGWWIAQGLRGRFARASLALAALLALGLQARTLLEVRSRLARTNAFNVGTPLDHYVGERRAIEWMRGRDDNAEADGRGASVLAHWDRGHAIEWAADRPSVATNFGSYITIDSYLDPSRFFLESDLGRAKALLEARAVRFVFVPGELPAQVPSMVNASAPERAAEWLITRPDGARHTNDRWLSTLGARLLHEGLVLGPSEAAEWTLDHPLDFLRLVHVSAYAQQSHLDPRTRRPRPAALVWERVAGAQLELAGEPDAIAQVSLDVEFEAHGLTVPYRARARVGNDGIARLSVPYSTETGAAHNDARAVRARCRVGQREGALAIPEAAVRTGGVVRWP